MSVKTFKVNAVSQHSPTHVSVQMVEVLDASYQNPGGVSSMSLVVEDVQPPDPNYWPGKMFTVSIEPAVGATA